MLSLGVDLLLLSRVERILQRYGSRFTDRILAPAERRERALTARYVGGRFAAKEAVAKALGSGLWRQGVAFTDIAILADQEGKPQVSLSGGALLRYQALGGRQIAVSISHEKDLVLATALLERAEP